MKRYLASKASIYKTIFHTNLIKFSTLERRNSDNGTKNSTPNLYTFLQQPTTIDRKHSNISVMNLLAHARNFVF